MFALFPLALTPAPSGLAHITSGILWAVVPEIVLFTGWAALIALLITFKTNSSYASYTEGRKLWTQVIQASRMWARTVWLHVGETGQKTELPQIDLHGRSHADEEKRKLLVEKRTYVNLIGAFSIALKHYVRGEPTIFYVDLYPLVSFLPRYRPSRVPPHRNLSLHLAPDPPFSSAFPSAFCHGREETYDLARAPSSAGASATPSTYADTTVYPPYEPSTSAGVDSVAMLCTAEGRSCGGSTAHGYAHEYGTPYPDPYDRGEKSSRSGWNWSGWSEKDAAEEGFPFPRTYYRPPMPLHRETCMSGEDEEYGLGCHPSRRPHCGEPQPPKLMPARNPPPLTIDDFVPFYDFFADLLALLCSPFRRSAHHSPHHRHHRHHRHAPTPRHVSTSTVGSRRSRRRPTPLQARKDGDNVPLELIEVLSVWAGEVQRRGGTDILTVTNLCNALAQLSEALVGLERVLMGPMPLAYSLYLRHSIWLFLVLMPFMSVKSLGWLTVPAVAIATFTFLGLLRLGDQIENPLGYDDSDLDLESFVSTILRDLHNLTARDPAENASDKVCFTALNPVYAELFPHDSPTQRDGVFSPGGTSCADSAFASTLYGEK
ncbi:hypothetical protein JCM10207_005231 [Rhodosporidiobolus poonsookiae]